MQESDMIGLNMENVRRRASVPIYSRKMKYFFIFFILFILGRNERRWTYQQWL